LTVQLVWQEMTARARTRLLLQTVLLELKQLGLPLWLAQLVQTVPTQLYLAQLVQTGPVPTRLLLQTVL
jgi:hypothetical protein